MLLKMDASKDASKVVIQITMRQILCHMSFRECITRAKTPDH